MAKPKWLNVILFFLSVWRLSRMITEEDGPGNVFTGIREFAGAESDGIPTSWEHMDSWGRLVQCPYCISVWIAMFLHILSFINKDVYNIVVLSFAGSAATVLIEEGLRK